MLECAFLREGLLGRFTGILGLLFVIGLAWVFSTNRRAIRLRTVLWGVGLQVIFAFLVLDVPAGKALFNWLGEVAKTFLSYSFAGSSFLFGDLGKKGPSVYVAFQVLPTIIFVAAFFAILYHYGVMQFIIRQMARDLAIGTEVIACPTVREDDGLALSSRNVHLGTEQRAAAPVLHRALLAARTRWEAGERSAEALRDVMWETLTTEPLADVDYVSVADGATLAELERVDGPALLSLAVRFGTTRLIDNEPLGTALAPDQVDEVIAFSFSNGEPARMTRGEMLLHVAMHAAGHRSQAALLLQKNGLQPWPDRMTDFLAAEAVAR